MVQMPPREYLEMFANADSIADLPDGSAEEQILHFKGENVGDYTTYGGNWTLARLLSTGIHKNGEDHYALPASYKYQGPFGYGIRLSDEAGLNVFNGVGGDLHEPAIATAEDIPIFLEGTDQERQDLLSEEERLIGSLFAEFSFNLGHTTWEDYDAAHEVYKDKPEQIKWVMRGVSENAMMFYDEERGEQIFDEDKPPLFLDMEAWELLDQLKMPYIEEGSGPYGQAKVENPLAYLVGRKGKDENGLMEAIYEAEVGSDRVAAVGTSSDGNRFEVKKEMKPENVSYERIREAW
jgi:hypothetical protein